MAHLHGARRAGAAAIAVLALGLALSARQATPPAGQEQPAFRAGADLVIVDAVVVDRDGRPVADLTPRDFEVRDDGRPQTVSTFQVVTTASAADAATGTTSRYPYSTNAGVDARPTRAFVLFFDDIHLTQADGDRAKEALTRFLDREVQAGDLISLVAPGKALRWHARMPSGRAELTRVIGGLRGLYAPDPSSEQLSDYEAYRISAFQDEQVAQQVERRWQNLRVNGRQPVTNDPGFRPENRGGMIGLIPPDIAIRANAVYQQAAARNSATLASLERTIEGLAAVRGRKAVLLMSPGFIDDQERADAKRTIEAARHANVAIYFVDARGLIVGSTYASAETSGRGLDPRDVGAALADITLTSEGATTLSTQTGGFVIRNQNDLGRGLERIGAESRTYYLLGFQPDRTDSRPGAFHRLEVKVARPDVTIRARRGYYSGTPGAASGTTAGATPARFSDGVDAIDRAADSPYEIGAIPLRVASYVFNDASPDTAVVALAVDADLRAFAFGRKGGRLTDVLDLRMLTTELTSTATERYERKVEMSFPETTQFGPSSWHPLSQEFHLKPGRYQARVAVRDANSGRIGAVTHDFEVPPLNGLRLTSPILTDTVEAPSFGSQTPPKPVLMARRAFPAGSTLYYQFSVLGAARDASGATRVVGSHELRGPGGAVVKKLEPRPIAGGSGVPPSRFAGLALTGLPAGDYELILKVSDEIGGTSVERHEPLAILPPEAPASADRRP